MAGLWTKTLETGLKWQDDQHRELFRRIEALIDAINMGLGRDEVLKLFSFLDEYFVVHFEAEERAMDRYDYPEAAEHLAEHTRFIGDIERLEKEAAGGVSTSLVVKTREEVSNWLVEHIGRVDRKLAEFLKKAEKEKKA